MLMIDNDDSELLDNKYRQRKEIEYQETVPLTHRPTRYSNKKDKDDAALLEELNF